MIPGWVYLMPAAVAHAISVDSGIALEPVFSCILDVWGGSDSLQPWKVGLVLEAPAPIVAGSPVDQVRNMWSTGMSPDALGFPALGMLVNACVRQQEEPLMTIHVVSFEKLRVLLVQEGWVVRTRCGCGACSSAAGSAVR